MSYPLDVVDQETARSTPNGSLVNMQSAPALAPPPASGAPAEVTAPGVENHPGVGDSAGNYWEVDDYVASGREAEILDEIKHWGSVGGKNTSTARTRIRGLRDELAGIRSNAVNQERVAGGLLDVAADADTNLQALHHQQQKDYDENYRPFNQEIIASLNPNLAEGNALVNRAAAGLNSPRAPAALRRAQRQMGRRGVSQTQLGLREMQHTLSRQGKLDSVDTMNRAYLGQDERNTRMRDQVINLGRGVSDSAMGNLTAAANSQGAVDNQNSMLSAQNTAARTQMAGSVFSLALMALILK